MSKWKEGQVLVNGRFPPIEIISATRKGYRFRYFYMANQTQAGKDNNFDSTQVFDEDPKLESWQPSALEKGPTGMRPPQTLRELMKVTDFVRNRSKAKAFPDHE